MLLAINSSSLAWLNFNLPRFGLLRLRESYRKDSILVVRPHLARINCFWQLKGTGKPPEKPFLARSVRSFIFFFVPALTRDRDRVLVKRNVDLLLFQTRELSANYQVVLVLVNVQCGCPRVECIRTSIREWSVEQTIDLVSQGGQLFKRRPTPNIR